MYYTVLSIVIQSTNFQSAAPSRLQLLQIPDATIRRSKDRKSQISRSDVQGCEAVARAICTEAPSSLFQRQLTRDEAILLFLTL